MTLFNNLIAAIVPYFPKFLVKPFAKPYVAGVTLDEAIAKVKKLNADGYATTLDILGEHVHSVTEATAIRQAYCELLERIKAEKLDSTISFKLTHLGLELDREIARQNTLALARKARELDLPVTIDMENSPYTDATIEIYQQAQAEFARVGTVLQAYLYRSIADVKALDKPDFHVRICKGIYREAAEIAIQDREDIRGSFSEIVKILLRGHSYAAIATHDKVLIDDLEQWIEENNIPQDRFEFQVLHGVPMGDRLERLLKKGYTVRVYVPFGAAWFDYAVRRLKENPNMAGYIVGNIFKRMQD
ncbi:MAG: proline dehydrogenase family protein [Candidatus Neomarinimicrobiota bacterium]